MKTTLLLLFLICATAAFAQSGASVGVLSGQVAPMQMTDHPQHASQHDLAQTQDLLEHSSYNYAQGERPMWEFGSMLPPPTPLGDVARAYRKEHASDKKAQIIWEK
jgi:hypothetical protein